MKLGIGLMDLKGDLYRLGRALVDKSGGERSVHFLDLNGPRAVIPYDLLTVHDDETAQELLDMRMATFSDILGQEGHLSLRMTRMLKYLLSLLLEFQFPFAAVDDLMEIENAPGVLAERSKDERVKRYFSSDFLAQRSVHASGLAVSPRSSLRTRRYPPVATAPVIGSITAKPWTRRPDFYQSRRRRTTRQPRQRDQSIVVSDICSATFRRKQPEVRFPWFVDEAQVLFERSSDRENLQRMFTMSRSFGTFIILLTQSLKAAIHETEFYQSLETNFHWLLLMRSGIGDAAILWPALRPTGQVRRGLDHTGRPTYLTPDQEIQSTLQDIANLPSRSAYFWQRGAGTHALRFRIHQLKRREAVELTNHNVGPDIATVAKARVEAARNRLATVLRSRPQSGDVNAFLSRIEKMRKGEL